MKILIDQATSQRDSQEEVDMNKSIVVVSALCRTRPEGLCVIYHTNYCYHP